MDKINNRLSGDYLVNRRLFKKASKKSMGHESYRYGNIIVSIHKQNIFIRLVGSKEVLVSSPDYTIAMFESLMFGLRIKMPEMSGVSDDEMVVSENVVSECRDHQ